MVQFSNYSCYFYFEKSFHFPFIQIRNIPCIHTTGIYVHALRATYPKGRGGDGRGGCVCGGGYKIALPLLASLLLLYHHQHHHHHHDALPTAATTTATTATAKTKNLVSTLPLLSDTATATNLASLRPPSSSLPNRITPHHHRCHCHCHFHCH